jgi:hypothetical protein
MPRSDTRDSDFNPKYPIVSLKWYLHYGENCVKLGLLKKAKIIFCSLKRTSLERLSPQCKHSVNEFYYLKNHA